MTIAGKLTDNGVELIKTAVKLAGSIGHVYIGTEHVLLAMVSSDKFSSAKQLLAQNGINYNNLKNAIETTTGIGTPAKVSMNDITYGLQQTIGKAYDIARSQNCDKADELHVLYAIADNEQCSACTILKHISLHCPNIIKCSVARKIMPNMPIETYRVKLSKDDCPNLLKYGKNITSCEYLDNCDPLIGRESEIEQVLQILARRNKNNPCLVGEAGVGKTAIVEGVAKIILENKVPDVLKNKFIIALDIAALLSGAKYRGDFEERIKLCVDEAINMGNIILFVDEIHMLVNTGAAEGAIDAANILKPYLARGDIHMIGATTYDEYRKNIEKDAALQRRFQIVDVREPDKKDCIDIITGIKSKYEMHHGVRIDNNIIEYAIDMAIRYIPDRYLPDKAIDIIDEACSRARLKSTNCYDEINITEQDIANVVSIRSNIPVEKISRSMADRIRNIRANLSEKIIGHDTAIAKITDAIYRAKAGLRDENRPIASFLFAGPTGVGKTETAKALADCMFDSENSLIRIDMSEYMESHSVSKLIGAPPGYIGYDDTSKNLCEQIRRNPYSIVLFDEIEKANPEVMNIFLQILDEGSLTDASARKVSFRNCIIIMTSNVGAHEMTETNTIGFTERTAEDIEHIAVKALCHKFTPEFMNRIDEVIVFNKLSDEDLFQISGAALDKLAKRAEKIGITLDYDSNTCRMIADAADCKKYGAREINRQITKQIENKISRMIIDGDIKSGDRICVTADGNDICIDRKTPVTN